MFDHDDPSDYNDAVSLNEHEIKEELKRLFLGGDDWSKEACMGYFLKACQQENLDIPTIQNLSITLYRLFDLLTVSEAKEFYYTHYYRVLSGEDEPS